MKRWLSAGIVGLLSGCYIYTPTDTAAPEMGEEVRVHLASPRDLSTGALVVRDITRVDGTLYQTSADTLVIWTRWLHADRGDRYFADGEIHPFVRNELASVEVRQLHGPRTALVSAAALGLGVGLFAFTADLGGGGINEGGPGDRETQVVFPLGLSGTSTVR